MTSTRRLKDEATEAEDRGEYDRAAALHERIAQIENDPYWLLRAGEALRRAGHKTPAVERVTNAAREFFRRGENDKTSAACRWVLALDPVQPEAMWLLRASELGDGSRTATLGASL